MSAEQIVDPAASRAKFAREIEQYRAFEGTYRRQGWLLLDASFPEVFVVFAAPKLKPSAIVAGVVIDFTDYDLRPPSVRFVDPFTREPLKAKDMTFNMMRRIPTPAGQPGMIMFQGMGMQMPPFQVQHLIQTNSPEDKPFLCLPGIREYHDNPAHTGDPWLLHRASGEGSLAFILEKIWTYGVNPIEDYAWQLKVQVLGFQPPQDALGLPT